MAGYSELSCTQYSVWMHNKTRSLYVVLGIALCSTNGPDEHKRRDVVYFSLTHGGLRTREASEFLDGRFTLVNPIADVDNDTLRQAAKRLVQDHPLRDTDTRGQVSG
jgi:hypothetical protein